MKKEFQLITITAGTPYERGVQHGEQAKEKIAICVEYYKQRFTKSHGQSWETIQMFAMQFIPYIEAHLPEAMEEARGIAAGSGRSLEDIMVVNNRYEISKFRKVPECTTAALLPPATRGGKTFLVKNWDYIGGILPHIVLMHIKRADGYNAFGIGEAGQMVRDGFNTWGVAFVNNDLQSKLDSPTVCLPATFIRKRLLESKTYEEACDFLLATKRTVSGNTMIAGAKGVARNFEASPAGKDTIDPTDGILTHANHFVIRPELDAFPDAEKNRDKRLYELLASKRGDITAEYIMACMADHGCEPFGVCTHPWLEGNENDQMRSTVASVIMDLSDNVAYVCVGNPCQGEYVKYAL